MIQLALETSTRSPSIAVFQDGQLAGERSFEPQIGASRHLISVADQLLGENGWKPQHLQLISLAIGPGSFTGLRVGVTVAKTLAYATQCSLTAVHTLDVIAAQVLETTPNVSQVASILNAERGDWFTRVYRCEAGHCQATSAVQIDNPSSFLASLPAETVIAGPALQKLSADQEEGHRFAPQETWQPTARQTGLLGLAKLKQGETTDPFELVPDYGRPSAAEEKKARQA